jgi:hypothetical protein
METEQGGCIEQRESTDPNKEGEEPKEQIERQAPIKGRYPFQTGSGNVVMLETGGLAGNIFSEPVSDERLSRIREIFLASLDDAIEEGLVDEGERERAIQSFVEKYANDYIPLEEVFEV